MYFSYVYPQCLACCTGNVVKSRGRLARVVGRDRVAPAIISKQTADDRRYCGRKGMSAVNAYRLYLNKADDGADNVVTVVFEDFTHSY